MLKITPQLLVHFNLLDEPPGLDLLDCRQNGLGNGCRGAGWMV
jgi:hypothetical protein